MPGKINAPNLSAPSLQALRAERHQETKGSSFWNKWSNLSTGQKWGRALAWVIPPIGIGFQIKANLWQAKAAAPRPMNSKVSLSEDVHDGIPLKGNVLFGNADREQARAVLEPDLNKSVSVILEDNRTYSAEMVGLPEQFAKDLNRKPNHSLQSQNGKTTVHIKPDSVAADRPAMFRDFFKREFPSDLNKADQWAVFAGKFLNQNGAAPTVTVTAEKYKYAVPSDDTSYNLKMENGGDSALVEVRAQGTPNEINGIDRERSKVDNFLLMRITLGPPEKLSVLSGHAKHELVAKADDAEEYSAVVPTAYDIAHQKTKEASRNFKSTLESRGITNAGQAMESIRKCKTVAGSLEAKDIKDINNKSLGGGNALIEVFLENPDLLDSQKPLAERQKKFASSYEVPAQKQLESKLVSIEESVKNGDIDEGDAENMRLLSHSNIATNRDHGKSLLEDLEFLSSFNNFANTVRSNNLTNAESMQVIRAHSVLKSASEDSLEDIQIHLENLFKGRALPPNQLSELESFFPLPSS